MLGPPLGGFLYQSFGYEVPFILLGCIVLLMVPLNMYILPNYGKTACIPHFKNLKLKYFYTFIGDRVNNTHFYLVYSIVDFWYIPKELIIFLEILL